MKQAALDLAIALATLEAYEADRGEPLSDMHELGRIEESRGSPSFRIRVGHIRRWAAALKRAAAVAGEEQVRSPVIRASEHLSSERRRGLEEALKWLDMLADGRLYGLTLGANEAECGKSLRALLSPSSEGGEEKTDG